MLLCSAQFSYINGGLWWSVAVPESKLIEVVKFGAKIIFIIRWWEDYKVESYLEGGGPTRHGCRVALGAQPTDRRMTGGRAVVDMLRLAPHGHPAKSPPKLSIVGAASGGSDSGGGARSRSQVRSQARLAARSVFQVIQGGKLIQAVWLHRARFFGPRDGCRAKAQLLSGWVLGANAQPGSVLLWPAVATWSWRSRKLWRS